MKLSFNSLRTAVAKLFVTPSRGRRSRRPTVLRGRGRLFFEPLEFRRLLASDLTITKIDAPDPAAPGGTLTYTIQVTNTGPDPATANIVDTFPPDFTGVVFTSSATGGATGNAASGSGNINNTVTMPNGSTITYTVTGTVSPTATGSLTNTASALVTGPAGNNDPTPAEITATTTITPQADLAITKTNVRTSVSPGGATSYIIVVSNSGPTAVTNAVVTDDFPDTLTALSFTATQTGGASGFDTVGSTDINDTGITLPAGATITYTVNATVSGTATGTIVNTATVAAPGVTEITQANNTSTDTDTVSAVVLPAADLSITKTNGVTTVAPGSTVTYVIVARNAGPGAVIGATVADVFPATLTGVTFTATGTGGAANFDTTGTGPINDTVDLPAGATITYVVTGTVSPNAAGAIVNTAIISGPVADATPANNIATDTDIVVRPVPGVGVTDLSVTKTDNAATVSPGGTVTYVIVVRNNGPLAANGVTVTDVFPPTLTGVTFTASGSGGATNFSSGSGNINQTVNLPVGSTITYIVTGQVGPTATGTVSNTVTVTPPATVLDVTATNNVATDTTTIGPTSQVQTNVIVTKTGGAGPVAPGDQLTYTITVNNPTAVPAQNVTVSDVIPADTTFVSATQTGGTTVFTTTTPPANGTGAFVATTPTLAAGASATFQLVVRVDDDAAGATIANTAAVTTTTTETSIVDNVGTVFTDVEDEFPGLDLVCVVETFNLPGAPGSILLEPDQDFFEDAPPDAQALIITGTARKDVIVVVPLGSDRIRVVRNGRITDFDRDAVQHIVVFAGGGNDVVVVNASLDIRATLFGEAGNDKLFGAQGDDGIDGGAGNDILFGFDGNDTICGDTGNDIIHGLQGNDFLGGDAGNDKIFGHTGEDIILGGFGNDKLFGGLDDDFVFGQEGNDYLFGEPGNDVLSGGAGNDFLFGSTGNDVLIGGAGRDKLFGESGDDVLVGGSTAIDDDLFALDAVRTELNAGGTLDDRIENILAAGLDEFSVFDDGAADELWGGHGDDWFIVGPRDRIRDFRSNDRRN